MRVAVLCLLVALAVAVAWFFSVSHQMHGEIAQCKAGASGQQVVECMGRHGRKFNPELPTCDRGFVDELGCYETPWTPLLGI